MPETSLSRCIPRFRHLTLARTAEWLKFVQAIHLVSHPHALFRSRGRNWGAMAIEWYEVVSRDGYMPSYAGDRVVVVVSVTRNCENRIHYIWPRIILSISAFKGSSRCRFTVHPSLDLPGPLLRLQGGVEWCPYRDKSSTACNTPNSLCRPKACPACIQVSPIRFPILSNLSHFSISGLTERPSIHLDTFSLRLLRYVNSGAETDRSIPSILGARKLALPIVRLPVCIACTLEL